MIAPCLAAAIAAPLTIRPNHVDAEVHFIAERDRCCPLAAALELWAGDRSPEPELALALAEGGQV